jgi:hypothetical protein
MSIQYSSVAYATILLKLPEQYEHSIVDVSNKNYGLSGYVNNKFHHQNDLYCTLVHRLYLEQNNQVIIH